MCFLTFGAFYALGRAVSGVPLSHIAVGKGRIKYVCSIYIKDCAHDGNNIDKIDGTILVIVIDSIILDGTECHAHCADGIIQSENAVAIAVTKHIAYAVDIEGAGNAAEISIPMIEDIAVMLGMDGSNCCMAVFNIPDGDEVAGNAVIELYLILLILVICGSGDITEYKMTVGVIGSLI